MRLHARLAPALLLLLASLPARAEEKKPPNLNTAATGTKGSVAQLALAQELYALGLARKDPVSVLAAAKLATAIEMKPVEQKKATSGTAIAGQTDGPEVKDGSALNDRAGGPPDAATMLASARALSGEDEVLAGLIEDILLEAARARASGANSTLSNLAAGQTDTWDVPFFGDSYAEIAVLGDGGANLDVLITDENGNTICYDVGWSDRIFCDFVPAWNGYFTVSVQNNGTRRNSYLLLTN